MHLRYGWFCVLTFFRFHTEPLYDPVAKWPSKPFVERVNVPGNTLCCLRGSVKGFTRQSLL